MLAKAPLTNLTVSSIICRSLKSRISVVLKSSLLYAFLSSFLVMKGFCEGAEGVFGFWT